jgi:ribosome-associated protein
MDYVDFVVHIFLTEKRAYYDIERLRKSARSIDLEQLKAMLREKTVVARSKPAIKTATVKKTAKKAVAKKPRKLAAVRKPAPRKTAKRPE